MCPDDKNHSKVLHKHKYPRERAFQALHNSENSVLVMRSDPGSDNLLALPFWWDKVPELVLLGEEVLHEIPSTGTSL
jgi:hypothetical protein